MAIDYVTRDELKAQAGIDLTDTEFDTLLDRAIGASSRGVDAYTLRHFYQVTETRLFASASRTLVEFGTFNDLADVPTDLSTDEDGDGAVDTSWDPSEYELSPLNPNAGPEPRPYRSVRAIGRTFPGRVAITGTWGWPEVPEPIVEATLIQAHRLFKRREAPEGVLGLNMFGTVRMGKIDSDVARMLRRYRLRVVA